MASDYDRVIDRLGEGVAELGRLDRAAVFGVAGEALLPMYRTFSEREGFGDSDLLRACLDTVWAMRGGQPPGIDLSELTERLSGAIPHADDFDAVDVTYAQDAVACADASLRWAGDDPGVDPLWIEYAIEPVKTYVADHIMSAEPDIGTEDELLEAVSEQARFQDAVAYCDAVIDFLRTHPQADLTRILAAVGSPGALQPPA